MDITILALIDKYDPSGIWCLASILWVIICGLLYSKGKIVGSCSSFGIFALCMLCISSPNSVHNSEEGSNFFDTNNNNDEYIANNTQTKYIIKPDRDFLNYGEVIWIKADDKYETKQICYYMPKEEYDTLKEKRLKSGYDSGYTLVTFLSGEKYHRFYRDSVMSKALENKAIIGHEKTVFSLNDYYRWDKVYDPINLSIGDGGNGCPTWVYNPGSFYVFGVFGFIPLLISMHLGLRK